MKLYKIRRLSLLLTMLLTLPLLCACNSAATGVTSNRKHSTYDRVMQSGKIRCGYLIWPPECIKDPNTGKLSGIGVEAIEIVAKKLGFTIEWIEEVSLGTMSEGLISGRYDLVSTPSWANANRAKVVNFSRPLFYSPLYIYARKGDKRFKNHWELINSSKTKIATVDGGTAELIVQDDFPQAQKVSMPQLTDNAQLLLNIGAGKADITFAASTVANRFIENNPGMIENINPDKPIRVFSNSWIMKRGEFEFKAMLDTVLDELINSGAMDKIIDKYEQQPNQILRVALPYQLPNKN